MRELIAHYCEKELPEHDDPDGLSWSTKETRRWLLAKWIEPKWGDYTLSEVKATAVEDWLGGLEREILGVVVWATVKCFAEGEESHHLSFRFRANEINQYPHWNATPLRNATPVLNAVVHGAVLDHVHLLHVCKREPTGFSTSPPTCSLKS